MQYVLVFWIIFLSTINNSKAQDSVAYTKDFRLYEGLYLNYQEFRYNWPISNDKIITTLDKNQLDFYSKLIEEEFVKYIERDGSLVTVKSKNVWGYCQNNIIYINQDKNFYRIPVFGAISNFIGTAEVVSYSPGYDPFMNAPINSTANKTREIRQYLFDFYSGEILPFNIDNLANMLKQDELVYKEYISLNKKKRKEFATKYIRMFNEKHLVYFPKN